MPLRLVHVQGGARAELAAIDRRFLVDRRLVLGMRDGALVYEVAPVPVPYEKTYPVPDLPTGGSIAALDGDRVLGRVDLSTHWTGFGSIDDLTVEPSCRRQGVGQNLIEEAQRWTRKSNLPGLRVETQDVNVAACRLYARCGFSLQGYDAGLYANHTVAAGEVALFWYWHC